MKIKVGMLGIVIRDKVPAGESQNGRWALITSVKEKSKHPLIAQTERFFLYPLRKDQFIPMAMTKGCKGLSQALKKYKDELTKPYAKRTKFSVA